MSAELFTVPFQCVVVSGLAVPGATLTFYTTGTTTKQPVYTTSALTTQQTNPVVANSAGHIPDTYLNTAITYRLVIKDKFGTELDDIDPYIPGVTTLGITLTSATGQSVNSRGALAALSPVVNNQVAFLTEAGREGMFVFSTANLASAVTADPSEAFYVAPASASTGASGAWVRRYSGAVVATWYGTAGDGSTDDNLPLQRWLDHGGLLYLPEAKYYSSDNLILRNSAVVEGEGYGFDNRLVDGTADQGYDDQPGSRIRFAVGKGFQIQPQTAQTDETATIVVSQEGAFNAVIRNLALVGAGTGATATGFYCRTFIHLDNVYAIHFTGKGFDISAALGPGADATAEYGNASQSRLRDCQAISNGSHGFHIRGGDANVITLDGCSSVTNGGWGFLDEGLLGNTYNGCHASANASGSYKCIGAVCNNVYNGCYVEPGTGQAPDISQRCTINGSLLADIALSYNVGSFGQPTIMGAGVLATNIGLLRVAQPTQGALTDRCAIYRNADQGLVLQGVSDTGTYTHVLRNQADEGVLVLYRTSKALGIQGPVLIAGTQVVAAQLAAVTGAVHCAGAAPTDAEYNATVDVLNNVITRLRTHGLIAT